MRTSPHVQSDSLSFWYRLTSVYVYWLSPLVASSIGTLKVHKLRLQTIHVYCGGLLKLLALLNCYHLLAGALRFLVRGAIATTGSVCKMGRCLFSFSLYLDGAVNVAHLHGVPHGWELVVLEGFCLVLKTLVYKFDW